MSRNRTIAQILSFAALSLMLGLPVWAVEIYTIGEAERAWNASGTTPGGVIAFVNSLEDVRDADGTRIFPAQYDSLQNWIMPLRLTPTFNISRDVLARGGGIDVPNLSSSDKDPEQLEGMLNGDHKIAFDRKFVAGRIVRNNGIIIRIDLGARFGMNRIVFYPRMTDQFPFADAFLRGYELFLNDGRLQNLFASGQPIFTSPVLREPDNRQDRVDVEIDPQFVRYLELKSISTLGFEIDEIEIYGRGFVPTASYVSNVLDLGEEVVWGKIDWTELITGSAEASRLEVRVRSGQDDTPDIYYRTVSVEGRTEFVTTDRDGDLLTQAVYENDLLENERGPIRGDAANWSQWQLIGNGDDLNLPAPRRYFQFSIDFANTDLDASRAVADLGFQFDRPPVDRIVAEIAPPLTEVGEQTTFTYVARIDNDTNRPGFERFEVETPARVAAIHSVEILDAEGASIDRVEFTDGQVGDQIGEFSIEAVEDDHFTLGIPRMNADGSLLKIVFDTAVFRYGTRFQGRAFADAETLIPLQSEGGDATPELITDELLVRVSVGSRVTGPLDIHPAVFTPNGDGTNDDAEISYTVLHLLEPSPAAVDIYDLSGRVVRQLSSTSVQNGRIPLRWDGRDDAGKLLPPGIYLVQVEIRSDSSTEHRIGSVTLVY